MFDIARTLYVRWPRLVFAVAASGVLLIRIVANASSGPAMEVSSASDRSAATAPSGAQLKGNEYIFLRPAVASRRRASGSTNPLMSETATHVENYAPIDFSGTAVLGSAKPWSTTKVPDGSHSISVKIVRPQRRSRLVGLDHTLAVAKAHGVKVVVTLADECGSCDVVYKTDSWNAGGYKTTVGPSTTVPYRQFVQEIVSRYGNDPMIARWQVVNEAEIKTSKFASSCSPATDLYNFAADVSGLIKSIDSNHLVNLGKMGGGQCGSQGGDYQKLGAIPSIDVLEFHDYGNDTTALPSNLASAIAVSKALGKPIFVGEAGIQVNSGGSLSTRANEFDAKCTSQFAAGVGGFLVWSWNNSPSNPVSWEVGPGDATLQVIDSY